MYTNSVCELCTQKKARLEANTDKALRKMKKRLERYARYVSELHAK